MGEAALLEAEPGRRFAVDVKGAPVRGRFLHFDPAADHLDGVARLQEAGAQDEAATPFARDPATQVALDRAAWPCCWAACGRRARSSRAPR